MRQTFVLELQDQRTNAGHSMPLFQPNENIFSAGLHFEITPVSHREFLLKQLFALNYLRDYIKVCGKERKARNKVKPVAINEINAILNSLIILINYFLLINMKDKALN